MRMNIERPMKHSPTKQNTIGPGSEFVAASWLRVGGTLAFVGFPAVLICAIPGAVAPVRMAFITIPLALFCLSLFVALLTAKVIITENGFRSRVFWWWWEYRFAEFKEVTSYPRGITLVRKDGRMNVALSWCFTRGGHLHDYVQQQISGASPQKLECVVTRVSDSKHTEVRPIV